ncbi:hypothetical protein GLA29479_5137 [Lysobacter antibioticus]|nr:hypothetical protein GLA29479_5137 [Lysobacter antibioticus]
MASYQRRYLLFAVAACAAPTESRSSGEGAAQAATVPCPVAPLSAAVAVAAYDRRKSLWDAAPTGER